jgi:hypothetical protein
LSFCGTIRERDRWKFQGLYFTCSGLAFKLIELQEDVYAKQEGKTSHLDGEDAQLRLFKLDNETRERFRKFAANLRYFTVEHDIHDAAYWKAYHEHEYNDYDFFMFFKSYDPAELIAIADALDKVADGEALDDYKDLMDKLHAMGSRADAQVDRGGCF